MKKPLPTDHLDDYLREIGQIPLIDKEQEQFLSKEIQKFKQKLAEIYAAEGIDEKERATRARPYEEKKIRAIDQLVSANLRLAVDFAQGFLGFRFPALSFADLIQEANSGLMRAAEDFDWQKGTKFSTYATQWMKERVFNALHNKARAIRIPAGLSAKISQMKKKGVESFTGKQKPPLTECLTQATKVMRNMVSIDTLEAKGTPAKTPPPHELLEEEERKQSIASAMGLIGTLLDPREKMVLYMRFGLDEYKVHSLKEVGDALGISKERTRQIQNEILEKLRKFFLKKEVFDY